MTLANIELLQALREAGASEAAAEAAARSVVAAGDAATKADLAELEMRLTWRLVQLGGILLAALALATAWLSGN